MADAPGGGWSAAEVIIALILGIGLITTLTGGTIKPIFDTPDTAKKVSSGGVTAKGCTVTVTSPKAKEKINNAVSVTGSFPECISSSAIPDTINAQVVDSKGTPLSVYTALPIRKSFFGNATFSGIVPLSGAAQSTTGYLILTTPARSDGSYITTRVAIQLIPGDTIGAPSGSTGGSYFVPNPSAQPNAPVQNNPTPVYNQPSNPNPSQPANPGSGGTTF